MTTDVVVAERFQGIEGRGQGGYLAGLLAGRRYEPYTVDFRLPIPLDTPLTVTPIDDALEAAADHEVIARGRPGSVARRTPPPVSAKVAEEARAVGEANPLTDIEACFSCGTRPGTLRVHAGPVGDGRFATPFQPPAWSADETGLVAPSFVWAPLDCASGWVMAWDQPGVLAVTGFLTVEMLAPVHPGEPLVIVAEGDDRWRSRKRWAWAALYDEAGGLRARAESLWIALDR